MNYAVTPTMPLVEKKVFTLPSYTTVGGSEIKNLQIGWERYGKLNADASNVILVPHYFSGNSHVAGRYAADDVLPGYWDAIIGPGKAIDTDRYFVIGVDSLCNLNTCDGITVSSGPSSINPDTGKPYGMSFPVVTIRDFVRVQKALIDSLGIQKLHAIAGFSMGGLQAYEWAAAFPAMVGRIIPISSRPTQTPFAIINLESWTAPVKVDPHWNNGDYYDSPNKPDKGVVLSFFNIFVGALHPEYISERYGHRWADPALDPAQSLSNRFLSELELMTTSQTRLKTTDANHLLYLARANQLFVAGTSGSSVAPDFSNIKAPCLVIQARTDLLFTANDARKLVSQMQEIGNPAEYYELDTPVGHLGGVFDIAKAGSKISEFLARPL